MSRVLRPHRMTYHHFEPFYDETRRSVTQVYDTRGVGRVYDRSGEKTVLASLFNVRRPTQTSHREAPRQACGKKNWRRSKNAPRPLPWVSPQNGMAGRHQARACPSFRSAGVVAEAARGDVLLGALDAGRGKNGSRGTRRRPRSTALTSFFSPPLFTPPIPVNRVILVLIDSTNHQLKQANKEQRKRKQKNAVCASARINAFY